MKTLTTSLNRYRRLRNLWANMRRPKTAENRYDAMLAKRTPTAGEQERGEGQHHHALYRAKGLSREVHRVYPLEHHQPVLGYVGERCLGPGAYVHAYIGLDVWGYQAPHGHERRDDGEEAYRCYGVHEGRMAPCLELPERQAHEG
jgi:hypothetical protein